MRRAFALIAIAGGAAVLFATAARSPGLGIVRFGLTKASCNHVTWTRNFTKERVTACASGDAQAVILVPNGGPQQCDGSVHTETLSTPDGAVTLTSTCSTSYVVAPTR